MLQKYCKQRQIESADYVNNLMRIDYIISAYLTLKKKQYINNMTECVLNYALTYARKRIKLDKERVPKSVETSYECKVTALYYEQVQIDRTIPNSKLDTVFCDNEKGICVLIDVAIS